MSWFLFTKEETENSNVRKGGIKSYNKITDWHLHAFCLYINYLPRECQVSPDLHLGIKIRNTPCLVWTAWLMLMLKTKNPIQKEIFGLLLSNPHYHYSREVSNAFSYISCSCVTSIKHGFSYTSAPSIVNTSCLSTAEIVWLGKGHQVRC